MPDAEARFIEGVDLRIAHDVYMDRAIREFTKSLHTPIRGWARQAADVVAERWPYSGGLTEEELDELVQPVQYGLITRTARMISESGHDLAGRLHEAWTEYLKQLARHEYRFQRAATLEYAADPERAEAERWREDLGDIPELAPFGQFQKQMGKVDMPPASLVNGAINAPAPWDGQAWSDRLPYMESKFGGSGHDIVRARMTKAMRDGEPINVIRREVADSLSADYQHKVDIVTRTETARVQNIMKDAEYEAGAKHGLFSGKQASAIFDRRTCVECASYDGNRYYYDGRDPSVDDSPVYPVHPFCVIGETPVFVPDQRAAFVSTYSGPVVEITLADARRLTVSPNHMFLAPQGWIRAKALREGNQVFDCPGFQRIVSPDPNNNRGPARIKDVVESFSEKRGMTRRSVPAAPEYLHGDGRFCNGDIDVIRANRFLLHHGHPRAGELLRQNGLDPGLMQPAALNGLSPLTLGFKSLRRAAEGLMGVRGVGSVLRNGAGLHHSPVGGGSAADRNPSALEPRSYGDPRAATRLSDAIHRLPITVTTTDIINVKVKTVHDLLLYDVETASSLYITNGLLSSNCRCMFIPIPKWADELNVGLGPRGTKDLGEFVGDFEAWMRRMDARDPDFARDWLGEKKYDRWSQGATLGDVAGTGPSSSPAGQLQLSQLTGLANDMPPPVVNVEDFTGEFSDLEATDVEVAGQRRR